MKKTPGNTATPVSVSLTSPLAIALADVTGFSPVRVTVTGTIDTRRGQGVTVITRGRVTFEDGGVSRFTVRVPLESVTAADILDVTSVR
jgi:hypothetical protein